MLTLTPEKVPGVLRTIRKRETWEGVINRRAQVFCAECGAPLFATAPEKPMSVVIRLGCVEQRAQLKPAVQIWQHSALPWLAELPGVPGSPEQQAFLPALT